MTKIRQILHADVQEGDYTKNLRTNKDTVIAKCGDCIKRIGLYNKEQDRLINLVMRSISSKTAKQQS